MDMEGGVGAICPHDLPPPPCQFRGQSCTLMKIPLPHYQDFATTIFRLGVHSPPQSDFFRACAAWGILPFLRKHPGAAPDMRYGIPPVPLLGWRHTTKKTWDGKNWHQSIKMTLPCHRVSMLAACTSCWVSGRCGSGCFCCKWCWLWWWWCWCCCWCCWAVGAVVVVVPSTAEVGVPVAPAWWCPQGLVLRRRDPPPPCCLCEPSLKERDNL